MPLSSALSAFLLLAPASPARAFIGFEDGLNAGYDVSNLLNTNPPLPMLRQKRGDFKLTLQPASFRGKASETSTSAPSGTSSGYRSGSRGDFKGSGGGVNLSVGLSDHHGIYAFFLGSSIRGDFEHCLTDLSPPNPDCDITHNLITGVDAAYQTIGLGMNFTFAEPGSTRRTAFGLFAGPTLTRMSFKQSFKSQSQSDTQTQPQVKADYDMSLDKAYPGFVIGGQIGTDLNKWVRLNPFFSMGFIFPGGCTKYKVPAVRTQPAVFDTADPSCTGYKIRGLTQADAYQIDMEDLKPFSGLGVNAEIRPLGLSINLTAPLLKSVYKKYLSLSGAEITMLSASWSFGRYQK